MKKCPKCGTVLDDSKKTCYMCGAVLNDNNPLNFGETFNNQIGAAITSGTDNVFNNVDSINQNNISEIYSTPAPPPEVPRMNPNDLFQNQFNNLNSMQYDERTALEKIFSNDTRFKSKDEINSFENNNTNNINNSNNVMENNPMDNSSNVPPPLMPPINTQYSSAYIQQPMMQEEKPKRRKGKKDVSNAEINWGDDLKDNNRGGGFHISLSFIFNTTCFILFVIVMIVVYVKFIRPKANEKVEFGGLVYSIDSEFNLKTDDKFSRYYTRGEKCTIRISYEKINDVDGFIGSYFDNLKDEYESMEGYSTTTSELKINGNTWQELSVLTFQENPSGVGGYSPSTKHKFVAMIYKGIVYDIRYSNVEEDGTCSAMYEKFINTLAFEKE